MKEENVKFKAINVDKIIPSWPEDGYIVIVFKDGTEIQTTEVQFLSIEELKFGDIYFSI